MQGNMLPITRPDPIRTRDRLRMLPRSGEALQQTIQYLTRAAQGAVRDVEPYIALSELNEIKRDIEQQKSTQATAGAPQTPMVQSLPEQVKQSAGIAGLQGARQQKSAQDMAQGAAQAAGPVPDGTPQPVPPQEQKEGLMSLPAGNAMNFRSGGIISFADEGVVVDPETTENAETDEIAGLDLAQVNATNAAERARLGTLQQQIKDRAAMKAPTATTDLETEMELAKKYPERFGILNTPAGQGQIERLDAYQQLARDEMAKRRQENQPSLGKALIAGAEASRGQKGFANVGALFMGAGKNAAQQREGILKAEQAMRKEDLGLNEAKMIAINKLQDLQRAKAEGDADKEAKARMDLAKIEKDFGVSINTLLGKEYTSTMGYLGQTDTAAINADARVRAARASANSKDKREKTLERLATANEAILDMKPGTPEYVRQEELIRRLERTVAQGRTSDVGPTRASIMREANLVRESADVREKMESFKYNPVYLDAMSIGDEAEAARLWNAELEKQRNIKPTANPAAPAANPAAPTAPETVYDLPPDLTGGKAALVDGRVYKVPLPDKPGVTVPAKWNATTKRFMPIK